MLRFRLPSFSVPPLRRWLRSLGRRRRAQQPSNPSFQEGPGLSPNNAGVLAHLRLRIRDGHRRLVSRLVPLPRLRVGVEGGMGQREVGKTWGRCSRQGVLNALVRAGVRIETSTRFPRGGGCETFLKALIFPSLIPLQPLYSTWPRLGGNLETCACNIAVSMLDLWCFCWSSMFHRNYLTDGSDSTLRMLPPGLVSCAGTMDGWVRSSSTERMVLCNHSVQYFWETCRFLFRFSAVMTSLVDTRSRLGWDPWIMWPSRRSLWSLLGQQVPSTAIPGPAGLFKISFWTGDTAFWGRCMAIWGYLYTSSGIAPLSGVLSSISLSPCLECSPARIVATEV